MTMPSKKKYIDLLPQPLLDDIVSNQCVPIIGAGFSRNAKLPKGKVMPLWNDLGNSLCKAVRGFEHKSPLDAVSEYEHAFSRPKLVEEMSKLLHIGLATAGKTHHAFCMLPFDFVVTTNLEFLLEDGYKYVKKEFCPVITDSQLSINRVNNSVCLFKLHGDLNHPDQMIANETDYDTFVDKFPLKATYLSNLMMTRTPIFIGYSLEDPDLRMIWQIIGRRMGELRRAAYAILLSPTKSEISRFERRGVSVIKVAGKKADYAVALEQLFNEIYSYWITKYLENSHTTNERASTELALPSKAQGRLCVVLTSPELLSQYEEYVFPIIDSYGFIPIGKYDIISANGNYFVNLAALADRADLLIADISSPAELAELRFVELSYSKKSPKLIVIEKDSDCPDVKSAKVIKRTSNTLSEDEYFLNQIDQWFEEESRKLACTYLVEPNRLLSKNEYRAAVLCAYSLFESEVRTLMEREEYAIPMKRRVSLSAIIADSKISEYFTKEDKDKLSEISRLRNEIAHTTKTVNKKTATNVVKELSSLASKIRDVSKEDHAKQNKHS